METKTTHAWENGRYTNWKTSHEDTAPKQDILQMDDAQMVKPTKHELNIQDKKMLGKIKVRMETSAFYKTQWQ